MKTWIDKVRVVLIFALFLVAGHNALASRQDAVELVRNTTNELLDEFKRHRPLYESDKSELYAMVERIVVPYFDFDRMARLVLGRYSRTASPTEFEAFRSQFKTLLIRTYATALFQYTGQKIRYRPQINEDRYIIVQASVQLEKVEPVQLEYFLAERDGKLKVFDVSIDGISLVMNYRKSYNTIIGRNGLQALIDDLSEQNSRRIQ